MDAERQGQIYDDLLKLRISIEYSEIPTPSYIQGLIIKCNDYQRRVERHFIEVTRELSSLERRMRTEQLNLEVLRRQTLTTNTSIKKLPTGKEREAAVDDILEDQHRQLLELENGVNSLKALLSSIKTVQQNLKSTTTDVRTLVKLMEDQVSRLNIGSREDPESRELNNTLSGLEELEDEMTADDVESAEEYTEPSEIVAGSQNEDNIEVPQEESADNSDDSDDQQPEDTSAEQERATTSGNGAATDLDVTEEAGDADEPIASFLADDSAEFMQNSESDTEEETESSSEEESSDQEDASEPEKSSEPAPESKTTGLDLDLSDIGIDLDTDTKSPEKAADPKPAEATEQRKPSEVETKTGPAEPVKPDTNEKDPPETPPDTKEESKAEEESSKGAEDFDIETLLNGL